MRLPKFRQWLTLMPFVAVLAWGKLAIFGYVLGFATAIAWTVIGGQKDA